MFLRKTVLPLFYQSNKNEKEMTNTPTVYEIKIGRKWSKVRATSMIALSNWAKDNNVSDWIMVGMQSRAEILNNKNIEIVA